MITITPERIADLVKYIHTNVRAAQLCSPDSIVATLYIEELLQIADALSTPPPAEGVVEAAERILRTVLPGGYYGSEKYDRDVMLVAEAALASKPIAGVEQKHNLIKFPHNQGGATDYCDCGNWSGSHCREKGCARPLAQRQELAALRAQTPVGGEVWAFLDVETHEEARRVVRAALDAANALEAKPIAGVEGQFHCVDQTTFYDPAIPTNGNCQQAVIASILGMSLEAVSNFLDSAKDFVPAYRKFVRDHGYEIIQLSPRYAPAVNYIAYGLSARNCSHSCIYNAGKLVHDPHPSRAGLISIECIDVIFSNDLKDIIHDRVAPKPTPIAVPDEAEFYAEVQKALDAGEQLFPASPYAPVYDVRALRYAFAVMSRVATISPPKPPAQIVELG